MNTYPAIENRSSWLNALEILSLIPKTRRSLRDCAHVTPTQRDPRKPDSNNASKGLILGTHVLHAGYGRGRILSNYPDGRVIVRFEKANKNQLIHPSFLSTI